MEKETKYKKGIQKHLYFSGELSCAELSELINKSVPLTSRVLNKMVDEGVVEELGHALSTGGRRPQMYALKPNLLYMVSVAMDQMITRIAMLDMRNNYVGKVKSIELVLHDNPDALHQLTQNLIAFIDASGIPKDKIVGIGIGMPGFVDIEKGLNYSFLKVPEGESITSTIESLLGIPVLIDNDSSLIALAELKLGSARNKQNVMVINISWGIGLGMILKGTLFNGHNGFAGEFSHIPIFTNNKMCSCGKTGCLETEASLTIVVEKAIEGLKNGRLSMLKDLSTDHMEEASIAILDAAAKGDKFAVELISKTAYNIGRGVAILIHLLNPELIVLSGKGSVAGKIWETPIQQAINEHCIPKISDNTKIEISQLGYEAELIGAAALVMEHFDSTETIDAKSHQKL
ncbi:ROK family transcriptional regulator [Flavobacterium sp. ZS1P14]|uniref:ROK family transcriptional regulator n=1 Tax=Flavobacterium sp. ZS1P14 TaxID=3401729 RepID=UPI003AAA56E8